MSLFKMADESRARAFLAADIAREMRLSVKLAAVAQLNPQKRLRATAAAAWHTGAPPKPKSIKPNAILGSPAKTRATAQPPSKKAFYRDIIQGMDPSYGHRMTVQGQQ